MYVSGNEIITSGLAGFSGGLGLGPQIPGGSALLDRTVKSKAVQAATAAGRLNAKAKAAAAKTAFRTVAPVTTKACLCDGVTVVVGYDQECPCPATGTSVGTMVEGVRTSDGAAVVDPNGNIVQGQSVGSQTGSFYQGAAFELEDSGNKDAGTGQPQIDIDDLTGPGSDEGTDVDPCTIDPFLCQEVQITPPPSEYKATESTGPGMGTVVLAFAALIGVGYLVMRG